MTTVKEKINVIPVKVSKLMHGIWAVHVLRTAVELKIFDQLEKASKDATALASTIKFDKRALEIFLDACVAVGLLKKNQKQYSLTDEAQTYLVSTSPLYFGAYLEMTSEREEPWRQLGKTVKSGKPFDKVNDEKRAQEFFPALAEMIFPLNFAIAQRVTEELKVSQLSSSAKVLDVAAGAGTWSIPMALANKSLHVDALDFASTLAVTKKHATKYGVVDRFAYISGNWREVPWQKNAYDVIILGHILHSEGEKLSGELIEHCFAAAKPGGKIVIAEMIADDQRNGPPFAMLFGINMLINTDQGCVFTDSQLKEMLTEAGFVQPYRMTIDEMPYSPIIIANKPG